MELKRVLSNLINNSVEAFDTSKGLLTVGIKQTKEFATLFVKDNGKGIPDHILKKLGTAGVTHGKEGTDSGSGLGVYHAKKTIESFGGEFLIESSVGQGTTILMTFKKASTPAWFVEKLLLNKNQKIVCVDDDVSIHQIWAGRLESLKARNSGNILINLSSGDALEAWLKQDVDDSRNAVYLVDYELLGQPLTGLDLIEKFKLEKHAILVTSRFEEPSIQSRCARLEVKLIPKGMASLVPIEFQKTKILYDAYLIDNDFLINRPIETNSSTIRISEENSL